MTAADTAACCAVLTLTGAAERLATTEMGIRFLGPCMTDAIARATVLKCGRTLCPVEVQVLDVEQTLVAIAHVTYIRLGQAK